MAAKETGRERQVVAAVFVDRDDADRALRELSAAGLRERWFGVVTAAETAGGEPEIRSGTRGPGALAAIERFFSEEAGTAPPLRETLADHDLDDDQIRRLAATLAPGNALVTVDATGDASRALAILRRHGARFEMPAGAGSNEPIG